MEVRHTGQSLSMDATMSAGWHRNAHKNTSTLLKQTDFTPVVRVRRVGGSCGVPGVDPLTLNVRDQLL